MTYVYIDSSSAILLEKSDLFDLFLLHADVVMSKTVYTEITKPGYPSANRFEANYHNKLFKISPCTEPLIKGSSDLKRWGKGERETIYLYLNSKKGYILIDDGKAARWCFKRKVPFINALLVPKLFWYFGLLSENECLSKTAELCTIGRYSNTVKTIAKNCTKDDLSYFVGEMSNAKKLKD